MRTSYKTALMLARVFQAAIEKPGSIGAIICVSEARRDRLFERCAAACRDDHTIDTDLKTITLLNGSVVRFQFAGQK